MAEIPKWLMQYVEDGTKLRCYKEGAWWNQGVRINSDFCLLSFLEYLLLIVNFLQRVYMQESNSQTIVC